MTTTTRMHDGDARAARGPKRREPEGRPWWLAPVAVLAILVAGAAVAVLATRDGADPTAAAGLPRTPDYHSLLVSPDDPRRLTLGTHDGLFRSTDGGLTWERAALAGADAMSLSRPGGGPTVWVAGHDVLARSGDGGLTWADVRPQGLPGLDIHGFAVDPLRPANVYAAVAGEGLYRSSDGGGTFSLVSRDVGAGVFALAVLRDGTLLAGDLGRDALMVSSDRGRTWRVATEEPVVGLAALPDGRVLASGPSGVMLSTDGAASWRRTLGHAAGTGPVAWAPGSPDVAYAVGLDGTLMRSGDGGRSWVTVEAS